MASNGRVLFTMCHGTPRVRGWLVLGHIVSNYDPGLRLGHVRAIYNKPNSELTLEGCNKNRNRQIPIHGRRSIFEVECIHPLATIHEIPL